MKEFEGLIGTIINNNEDYNHLHYYKINGKDVYALFETNSLHGSLLRQWIIDGNQHSKYLSKYTGNPLLFDCSNGLLMEEIMEEDSFVYEEFLKPLGIAAKDIPVKWKIGRSILFGPSSLEELLKKLNIDFEVLEGIV